MDPQVQAAWITLGAQAVGVVGGLVGILTIFVKRRETRRLRMGFLMLADERRREFQDQVRKTGQAAPVANAVTAAKQGRLDVFQSIPENIRELAARKYRIDTFRDQEWRALGKPRGKDTGRPI